MSNAAVLQKHELSHDELVSKMRLLSLIALGSESPSGEVAYDDVQSTLEVRTAAHARTAAAARCYD